MQSTSEQISRQEISRTDADPKTLYFTAVTGLYRLRVNVAGSRL
jgi:hypothetical protein